MNRQRLPLSRALICNDDGIDAGGLACLQTVVERFFAETWVVAPLKARSAASRSIMTRQSINYRKCGERRFSVEAGPIESLIAGLDILMDARPDFVFSGINHGANIADDIYYSGTVGIAMEACRRSIPAIAFSAETPAIGQTGWTAIGESLERLTPQLIEHARIEGMFLNVNFPAKPEPRTQVAVTRPGCFNDLSFGVNDCNSGKDGLSGNFTILHHGDRGGIIPQDTDIFHLRKGEITVSPISLQDGSEGYLDSLAGLVMAIESKTGDF